MGERMSLPITEEQRDLLTAWSTRDFECGVFFCIALRAALKRLATLEALPKHRTGDGA